jgi:hypothetical protein
VPLVLELVGSKSVVDFGSGVGTWIAAFLTCGVSDVLGIDGDYVDCGQLQIPATNFRACNLAQEVDLQREFELCMSVEVAEHLPLEAAPTFVGSLTRAAPVVLFSAALPMQGGDHHINEQWPSYWAKLFAERGYVAIDAIRSRVWSDDRVQWWYAQNMLIFCRETDLSKYPRLAEAYVRTDHSRLDLVHPRHYMLKSGQGKYWIPRDSLREVVRALPGAVAAAVRRRLH